MKTRHRLTKLDGRATRLAPRARTRARRAQPFSTAELARRTVERRGVEAAIWGMPIVSVDAMRRGFFGVGARYGDIAYCSKPADWKLQLTTPNSSSLYVYFNFNLREGPLLLDFPAAVGAGLFGSILDAWQVPLVDVGPAGEDQGKGGRYLILPPEFRGDIINGFLPVRCTTYNGYAAFRAIPVTQSEGDVAQTLSLVKQLRLYPLSRVDDPPYQRFIDISEKLFDGIANFDDAFYDCLARMVEEEPVHERDLAIMGQLRSLGIEKGKVFNPDAETRHTLKLAIAEAHARFVEANTNFISYWPGTRWGLFEATGPKTGFSFQSGKFLDVDARGNTFFMGCAPPKKLGAATFYLGTARDATGAPLDGSGTYQLHVPPHVPAKQFWAVTVYDLETAGFIRNSPKTEINSYHDLQKNADGSVDVFFGSQAPAGKESNWIYTAPGQAWFAFFRFYGPEKAVFDKSWKMGDIAPVKAWKPGAKIKLRVARLVRPNQAQASRLK